MLRTIPYLREVETADGPVGIAHTLLRFEEFPDKVDQWEDLIRGLEEEHAARHKRDQLYHPPLIPLYGRPYVAGPQRDADGLPPAVEWVRLVITGHTVLPAPAWVQRNVLCIDTGACTTQGYLSIAEIQSGEPKVHRFPNAGETAAGPD